MIFPLKMHFILFLFFFFPQDKSINNLLEHPINLKKFKTEKAKNYTNSIEDKCSYLMNFPASKGFVIKYYFNIDQNSGKYSMTVFKQGESIGFYDNSDNETLLSIESKFTDKKLGELDLVGKSIDKFMETYGKPSLQSQDYIVYQDKENRSLILKTENKKIKWFKYLRAKKKINLDLLNDECLNKLVLTHN